MREVCNYYAALNSLYDCHQHVVGRIQRIEEILKGKKRNVPDWLVKRYVFQHSNIHEKFLDFKQAKSELAMEKDIQSRVDFYVFNRLKELLDIDKIIFNIKGCRHWGRGLWNRSQTKKSAKDKIDTTSLESRYDTVYQELEELMTRVNNSRYDLQPFSTTWTQSSEIGLT